MKVFKKAMAVALALLMVVSLVGCLHAKDEKAVTIGDVTFTSAQYLYALVQADLSARETVVESLGEGIDVQNTQEIDYYSQEINKKNFVDYVEDEALKTLKKYAAIITKCKENKIELTDEQNKELDAYVSYYWDSYGYSVIYEPNGISKETFRLCTSYDYLSNAYFESIYGKEGSNPVDEKEVNKALTENFVIANILSADFSQLTEDQKTQLKDQYAKYADRLKKGEKFVTIYNEYNGTKEEDNTAEIAKDENGVPTQPADKFATVVGNTGTSYESELFEPLSKMKNGEVQVYTLKDDAGIALLIKQDITKDAFYMNTLYNSALDVLKGDEFDDIIDEAKKDLETKTVKSVIKRLKVKNIVYEQ